MLFPRAYSKPGSTDTAKPGDAAKAGDAAKPGETAKPESAKDEKYWRDRMDGAREELRRNEAFRDALQSRINALTAEFSARDDPYQRARIAASPCRKPCVRIGSATISRTRQRGLRLA